MAGNAEVRTVLRIDGQPQGAVEALKQVQSSARDTGIQVTRVTETISQQSEKYADKARARIAALYEEHARLERLRGTGGQQALAAQEERIAQARAQVYAKTAEVQQAEERLAAARRQWLILDEQTRAAEHVISTPETQEANKAKAVALRRQLADATVQVAAAEQHLATVVQQAGAQRKIDQVAEERLVAARENLTTVDARLRAGQKELIPLQQQLAANEQKRVELQERIAKAEAEGNNRSKARNLTELNKAEAERTQLLTQIEAKEKALQSVEIERAEALHTYTTAEKSLTQAKEQQAAAEAKLRQEEAALKTLRQEVATADQRTAATGQKILDATTKLSEAEARSVQVRYRVREATEAGTAANRRALTVLQQFIAGLTQAAAQFQAAGRNLVAVGSSLRQSGSYLRAAGSELLGLRNVVNNTKQAWATYTQEVQHTSLAFRPANQAVLTFIQSVASGVRASVSWSTVLKNIGLAARSLLGAFGNSAKATISLTRAFAALGTSGVAVVRMFGQVGAAAGRVLGAIGRITGGLNRLSSGFATTGTHIGGLAVKLQGAQLGLYSIGTGLEALATKGRDVFGGILDEAGKFQNAIVTVTSVLGTSPGVAGLADQIRDLALQLGQVSLFSPTEAANVISELVKGGMSLAQVMGTLKDGSDSAAQAVLNLATATGEDLSKAVSTVIAATTQWSTQNLNARDAVNDLTRVANATASDVNQLAGGMKNAGSVAAAMGVSFHDTLLLLGSLSNAGLKGPEGGTALRYFLLNLVPTSQRAIDQMKRLGLVTFQWGEAQKYAQSQGIKLFGTQEQQIDQLYQNYAHTKKTFQEAIDDGDRAVNKFQQFLMQNGVLTSVFVNEKTGALKGANEILDILGKVFAERGPVEGTKLLSALFGERGGSKAAAPLMIQFQKNLADMEDLQKRIADAKAKGQKDLAAQLQGQLDQMRPNLIDAITDQLKNYGSAEEIAAQRAQTFQGALEFLTSSFDTLKIALGTPLLQPMANLFHLVGDIVNKVTEWGQKNPELVRMVGTVAMLAVAFGAVVGPIVMLAAAWPIVVSALTGAAAGFLPLLGIITLLGGALVGLGLLIGDPSSGLGKALSDLGKLFQDMLPTAIQTATHILLTVFLPIGRLIANLVTEVLLPAGVALARWFTYDLPRSLDGIIHLFTNQVFPVLRSLADWFAARLPQALALLSSLWTNLLGPIVGWLVDMFVNWLLPTLANLYDWFAGFLPTAIQVLAGIWTGVLAPVLTWLAGFISGVLIPAVIAVAEWLGVHLPPVVRFLAQLWAEYLAPALNKAVALFNQLWPVFLNIAGVLVDSLLPPLKFLADLLGPVLLFALDVLGTAFRGLGLLWDTISAAWQSDFGKIRTAITFLMDVIGGALGFVSDLFKNVFGEADKGLAKMNGQWNDAGQQAGASYQQGLDSGLQGADTLTGQRMAGTFQPIQAFSQSTGPAAFLAGTNFRQGLDAPLTGAEQDTARHMAKIRETSFVGLDGLRDDVIKVVSDFTATSENQVKNWGNATVDSIIALRVRGGHAAQEYGEAVRVTLQNAYGISLDDTSTWCGMTLDQLIHMKAPAGEYSEEIGRTVQVFLAQELGVSLDKVKNWKYMTVEELVSMADPSGAAALQSGEAIRSQLEQKLGISLENVKGWRGMTLLQLQSMEQPAGQSGYNTGYNASAGVASGLDANMDAIVARVRFMREQLGIALQIQAQMSKSGKGQGFSRWDADDARRELADAEGKAATAGIPDFLLDLSAGPSPIKPGGLGTYQPPNFQVSNPNLGGDDGNLPNFGGDNGGGPSSPYNTNTEYPGFGGAAGGGGGGSKGGSTTTRSPAEEAADLAKKTADAISEGMKALRNISGFSTPSNLQEKVQEFAAAVAMVLAAFQSVSLRFEEKALQHTGDFLDAAQKGMDTLGKGLDAFSKIQEFVAPTHANLDTLVQTVDYTVQQFAAVATKYKSEVLGQVQVYADAADKAVDVVGKAADAFKKLDDFSAPTESSVRDLVASVDKLLTYLRPLATVWSPDALAIVSDYADAAGKVVDGLSKAADLFQTLLDPKYILANPRDRVEALSRASMEMMEYISQLWTQEPAWTQKNATKVGEFAAAAGQVADGLTKAVTFFDTLTKSRTNFAVLRDRVQELINAAQHMMNTIGPVAAPWGKFTDTVEKFADASGKVADGLLKSVEFFDKLNGNKTSFKDLAGRVQEIINAVRDIMARMAAATPKDFEEGAMPSFAETTGKVVDALSKALDFLSALGKAKKLGDAGQAYVLAQQMVAIVRGYENALISVGVALNESGAETEALAGQIADSQAKVVGVLSSAFDLFSKLSEYVAPKQANPQAVFQNMLAFLLDVVRQFAAAREQFAAAVDEETAALAETVGKTVSGLAGAFDLFDKLGTYRGVSNDKVASFIASLRFTIQLLKQGLLGEVSEDMLDLAQQFGEKLGPAFDLLSKALDLFKALTGEKNDKGEKSGGLLPVDINAIEAFIQYTKFLIQRLKDGLLNEVAPEMLDLANEFGTKMGPAIDVLDKSLGIFLKLAGDGKDQKGLQDNLAGAVGALVYDLYVMLHHWNNVIKGGEFQGDFAARSEAFAATVAVVVDSVQKVLDLAGGLKEKGTGEALAQLPPLIATVGQSMQAVAAQFHQNFAGMEQDAEQQANHKAEGTLLWAWAAQILGRMIYLVEGKNGAKVQLRVAFRTMLSDLEGIVAEGAPPVVAPWLAAMQQMVAETQAAVAQVIATINSLNGLSATFSYNVSTGGGAGASTGNGSGGAAATNPATNGAQAHLAVGGIVTKPTVAEIGEGGEPEAVVPLSKAKDMGFGGGGNTYHYNIRTLQVKHVTDLAQQKRRNRQLADDPS